MYGFTYCDFSEQKGNCKNYVRKFKFWKWILDYFDSKIVKTCDLDPKKQYIFAVHPHGFLPWGSTIRICM